MNPPHAHRLHHHRAACALTLLLALAAPAADAAGSHSGDHAETAIGEPGQAERVTRTVRIDMTDAMRFTPPRVTARRGQTIRFIVSNSGKLKHELVLGTRKDLRDHAEQMKKFPEMEHAEPNMVTLAPGQTGEVIWRFTRTGQIDFACLQPGHYDAGMKGFVKVASSPPGPRGDPKP